MVDCTLCGRRRLRVRYRPEDATDGSPGHSGWAIQSLTHPSACVSKGFDSRYISAPRVESLDCEAGWQLNEALQRCYRVPEQSATFAAAQGVCAQSGARLALLTTPAMQGFAAGAAMAPLRSKNRVYCSILLV